MVTPVTVATEFPTKTVNVSMFGDAEASVSLNVMVTVFPEPATDAKVGGTMSGPAVDEFVTAWLVSATESFPAASWIAALSLEVLDAGGVYETVTVLPAWMLEPKFNVTADPLAERLDTVNSTPSTMTSNASAVGRFAPSASP